MVRIRLRRVGLRKQPSYRIVVADRESPRDGRYIEIIGFYNPRTEPITMELKEDRALYWLSVGAQPSEPVWSAYVKANRWKRWSPRRRLKRPRARRRIPRRAAPRPSPAQSRKKRLLLLLPRLTQKRNNLAGRNNPVLLSTGTACRARFVV
jgi:small subunit ribosomal protein S16